MTLLRPLARARVREVLDQPSSRLGLVRLELELPHTSAPALTGLVLRAPALERVSLTSPRADQPLLEALPRCALLRAVRLRSPAPATTSLEPLNDLPRLRSLSLTGPFMLQHLGSLIGLARGALRELELDASGCPTERLSWLAELRSLERLWLADTIGLESHCPCCAPDDADVGWLTEREQAYASLRRALGDCDLQRTSTTVGWAW